MLVKRADKLEFVEVITMKDNKELIGRNVIAAAIIIAGFFISDAIRDAGVTIATHIANAIH